MCIRDRDDLNMPRALAVLWELVRDENATGKLETIKKMDEVFGLKLLEKEKKINAPADVKKLADEREKARNEKNWKMSDELRNKIAEKGWKVSDSDKGYKLEKI